jgi:tRNA modification GTPase
MNSSTDTIAACATAPGRAGVAIVRVSGKLVRPIAEKILGTIPAPRYAELKVFYDDRNLPLDQGLALFFPAPHSLTGEDVLELHSHANAVLVDLLLKLITRYGARMAAPGEFLERAFLNNKIDLVQAEAIADMIDAQSEQALRSASRSMQGFFSEKINLLVRQLIELRKMIEAYIDFSDEEIEFLSTEEIASRLNDILTSLLNIENTAEQGSLLQTEINIAIIGDANAGKSSLLNRLAQQEAAIVTDIPGTTRDVIRERIFIDGLCLRISDTAGIRETQDLIEQLGIQRAKEEIEKSDLVLLVHDCTKNYSENNLITSIEHKKTVLVLNKIDLIEKTPAVELDENNRTHVYLSAKTGEGVDQLKNVLKQLIGFHAGPENTFSARRRHLIALTNAKEKIISAVKLLQQKKYLPELLAEELRLAQIELDKITGRFTSDDLLGEIFSSFCLGK